MLKVIKACMLACIFVVSTQAAELMLSGSVISDNQKIITSRFMGFVQAVSVSEGTFVKKGDLLYVIDSKEIDTAKAQVELSIDQAMLSLQMYQNQHENILINLKRHKRLYEKDMVSKFELETLELNEKNLLAMVEIAKKQVNQAKARLKEIENQYKYLRITAPNDGVVIAKNIKVGEMAMPATPAIVLSDLADLKISTEISESNLALVHYGKKVRVQIPSIKLECEGSVAAVIPSSNPMTHSFKIKVAFDNHGKKIYPGMYATVAVK